MSTLSDLTQILILGAIGDPDSANQIIDALESSGTSSINGVTGDVVLVAGSNVTITPSGQNITIAAAGSGSLPPPLEALASYTNSRFMSSTGSFVGNVSDNDQTNELVQFGSTDTAIVDNNTSNLEIYSGSNTSVGASGNTGSVFLVSGQILDSTSSGNTGNIIINSGNSLGSGSSGTMTLNTGTTTTDNSGGLNISTGNSGTGGSGSINISTGSATNNSGQIVLSTGNATTQGVIQFQDGTQGTAGQVWTSTDTSGTGHWVAASGGANTTLSNLTSPTFISVDLLPGGSGAFNLGTSSDYWQSGYIHALSDNTGTTSIDTFSRNLDFPNGQTALDWSVNGAINPGITAVTTLGSSTAGWASVSLGGSTSGTLTQSASATTTPYSIIWPAVQATGLLDNDGAGNLSWTTTVPVTSGGTGTSTAFTSGSVIFAGASGIYSQNNADLFWDNTNDRLGIGNAVPQTAIHSATTLTTGAGAITAEANNSSANTGGIFSGRHSRGTFASPSAVQSGDRLATFGGQGYGASQYSSLSTGNIHFNAAETFTNTANGTLAAVTITPLGSTTSHNALIIGANSSAQWFDSAGSTNITFVVLTGTTSYTLNWPTAQGAAGTKLTNDGAGNLSWT